MWSCSFCMKFGRGERLELEKAVPGYRRPGRSISVSAVPFGPGTDIWRSCRFIGALFRGLQDLLLGLRRFVPCDIGASHTGCGTFGGSGVVMVLLPGPESLRLKIFLNWLLILFGYPSGSVAALLADVLLFRYCSARLACGLPN